MSFQVYLKTGWRNISSGFVPAGVYSSEDPRYGQYVNYWLETDQAVRLPDPEPEPIIAPEVIVTIDDPSVDLPVTKEEGEARQLELMPPVDEEVVAKEDTDEAPEVDDDPGDRDQPIKRAKSKRG